MAALTRSGVTTHDFWHEGSPSGNRFKVAEVTLVLSSQGGLTNNIPASLFGMTRIVDAFGFRDTSSVRTNFGPSLTSTTVGAYLVGYANTNATDANRNDPADLTGTFRGYVVGIE